MIDIEFKRIIIDALTEAIERNTAVSVKNSSNTCIIVLTAIQGKIIMSLSKMSGILDDLIHVISDALGIRPDLVYNRISTIKEDFIIYYAIWIKDYEESKAFIQQEFALPQNNITFISPTAIELIKDSDFKA